MYGAVGKQPKAGNRVPLPEGSQTFVLVQEKKAVHKAPFAVKGPHLTQNLHHFERRGGGLAENTGKTDTQETLRTCQSVIPFNGCHPLSTKVTGPS